MIAAVLNPLDRRLADLDPIGLAQLDESASLLTRVDRKYVLSGSELSAMLDAVAHRVAALEIDAGREFAYESVYFDTPQLDFYLGAAHRRRRRCKVRTRGYLDAGVAMLEVKTKGLRGETVKVRQAHDFSQRRRLDGPATGYVDEVLGRPGLGHRLVPTLTSRYRRITLVDLDDVARVTIDRDLRCADERGASLRLGDRVIVETKSSGTPSFCDRWLWANGRRPEKLSKFGTSLGALRPELPSNKWHRTIGRYFADDV
ncbi:MAG: polyphosphate polymerase domain-containing protein [Microthrixaceae bacterium]|nr:polyphosphate polymerase domain-containing protein [Microthrixaceae bacterium]